MHQQRVSPIVRNSFLLFAFLAAASCTGQIGEGEGESGSEDDVFNVGAVSQQERQNALLIHDQKALDIINEQFDMGVLLGEVGARENLLAESGRGVGRWVAQIFELAQKDQDNYRQFTLDSGRNTMGAPVTGDRRIKRVLQQWTDLDCQKLHSGDPEFRAIKQISDPQDLKSNTFRLLAVVNRMDLAGEYDDRLTNDTSEVPRFLGEVHLVYGLIDRSANYENSRCNEGNISHGPAYPMTFVLSYRLPVIKDRPRNEDPGAGGYRIDTNRPLFSLGEEKSVWRDRAWMWADSWAHLSSYGGGEALARETKKLLRLAVRPENFLALKTNTKVSDNEFELREWYIFASGSVREPENANGLLIPRKLRREPYACLDKSMAITKLVNHYWKTGVNDLDMVSRAYHLGEDAERNFVYDGERGGYALMRDQRRPLMSELGITREGENNYFWNGSCGTDEENMEYAMLTGTSRNLPPIGDKTRDRLMFLPPFARVKNRGKIWQLKTSQMPGESDELRESKRHAFAIRTCSGCHSQEGATKGFHIRPRRAGANARLSTFLEGEGSFEFAGKTYNYDTLESRRRVLNRFLRKEQGLYQALKLPERH